MRQRLRSTSASGRRSPADTSLGRHSGLNRPGSGDCWVCWMAGVKGRGELIVVGAPVRRHGEPVSLVILTWRRRFRGDERWRRLEPMPLRKLEEVGRRVGHRGPRVERVSRRRFRPCSPSLGHASPAARDDRPFCPTARVLERAARRTGRILGAPNADGLRLDSEVPITAENAEAEPEPRGLSAESGPAALTSPGRYRASGSTLRVRGVPERCLGRAPA